jgi:uncharacterized protein YjiS (DUF1127 family)
MPVAAASLSLRKPVGITYGPDIAVQHFSQGTVQTTGDAKMSLPHIAYSLAQRWMQFRNYRETVSELRSLDDRDLGIGRSDITRLAREAVAN